MNKYGSNVVERCIRDSTEEQAARIIREIYDSPNFLMVLQDPFGNYVTQTMLELAKVWSSKPCMPPFISKHILLCINPRQPI